MYRNLRPKTSVRRRTRGSIAALAAASLLALSACSEDATDPGATESESSSAAPGAAEESAPSTPPAAPEPDLENIPDPVAEVNGDPISKDEFVRAYKIQFQTLASQAQASGGPLDQDQLKKQTAESLVGNKLLSQEADRREITADQGLIDQEISSLLEQNGLSSQEELKPLLEQQGLTVQDLLDQIETQVRVNQLIFAVDPSARKVSGKEVRELYDQVTAQAAGSGDQTQQVPPLKQVRTEVVDQVRTQKTGVAAQKLADKLRKEGEVSIAL